MTNKVKLYLSKVTKVKFRVYSDGKVTCYIDCFSAWVDSGFFNEKDLKRFCFYIREEDVE